MRPARRFRTCESIYISSPGGRSEDGPPDESRSGLPQTGRHCPGPGFCAGSEVRRRSLPGGSGPRRRDRHSSTCMRTLLFPGFQYLGLDIQYPAQIRNPAQTGSVPVPQLLAVGSRQAIQLHQHSDISAFFAYRVQRHGKESSCVGFLDLSITTDAPESVL